MADLAAVINAETEAQMTLISLTGCAHPLHLLPVRGMKAHQSHQSKPRYSQIVQPHIGEHIVGNFTVEFFIGEE